MKKNLDKITISPEKKKHYQELQKWLIYHQEIKFRKLHPYGFSIDISTVPEHLEEEFLKVCTF
jgi:hypothetical protein